MAGFDDVDKSSLTGVEETQAEQEEQSESVAMEQAREDAMNEAAIEMEQARRNDEATQRHNDRVDYNRALRDKARTAAFDPKEIDSERNDIKPSIGSFDNDNSISATNYDYSDIVGKPIQTSKTPLSMGGFLKTTPRVATPEMPNGASGNDNGSYGFMSTGSGVEGYVVQTATSRARPAARASGYLSKSLLPGTVFKIEPRDGRKPPQQKTDASRFFSQSGSISNFIAVPSKAKPKDWSKKGMGGVFSGGTVVNGILGNLFKPVRKTPQPSVKGVVSKPQESSFIANQLGGAIGGNTPIRKTKLPTGFSAVDAAAKQHAVPTPPDTIDPVIAAALASGASVADINKLKKAKTPASRAKTLLNQINTATGSTQEEKVESQNWVKGNQYREEEDVKKFGNADYIYPTFESIRDGKKITIGGKNIPEGTYKRLQDIVDNKKLDKKVKRETVNRIINQVRHTRKIEPSEEPVKNPKVNIWGSLNPYQKSLFPDKTKSVTQDQLDAKRSAQRKSFFATHPVEEREQQKAEAAMDLRVRGKQSPYAQTEFGSSWLTNKANVERNKKITEQIKMDEKYSAIPDEEKNQLYTDGRPSWWTPAKHEAIVKGNVAYIRETERARNEETERKQNELTNISDYWKEEGIKSRIEINERKKDIADYWEGMASISRKEVSEEKADKSKKDKTFLENNAKALEQRLGGYNVPIVVEGKKTTKFVPYKDAVEAQKAKETALRADYLKKTPLLRQLTDTAQGKKPYNDTKANRKPGIFEYMKDEDIVDSKGKKIGTTRVKVNELEAFKEKHPVLTQLGGIAKKEVRAPFDDLMAGRKARADENRRSFFYGGGLQPVNITKGNPEGEFPKQTGKTARRRHKNPVTGTELSFFGKPFGAPKAPRRTRRGKVIKLTPAQRKRNSRKPKSFLDDVFGGRW